MSVEFEAKLAGIRTIDALKLLERYANLSPSSLDSIREAIEGEGRLIYCEAYSDDKPCCANHWWHKACRAQGQATGEEEA